MAAPLTLEVLRALFRSAADASVFVELLTLAKVALAAKHDAETCLQEVPDRERWILNVRPSGGDAPSELHRDWHDLSLYLTGGNDLRVGGTLVGAQEINNGEWQRGTLAGGTAFQVCPGDLLWTPAGVPHQSHFLPHTVFVIVKLHVGTIPSFPLPAGLTTASDGQHLSRFHNLPVTREV